MTELKAYSCTETYSGEWTGGIHFAKSNLEARKIAANEYNDGELGGLQVKRAPWADKYGSGSKIPVSDMVDHGWHFECIHSGVTIDESIYYEPREVYNEETKEYEEDNFLIGKKPTGFQYGWCFACQEWEDEYKEEQRKRKEYEEEVLKFYRAFIWQRLPEAVIVCEGPMFKGQYIYTEIEYKTGIRTLKELTIPFEFPGSTGKSWLELKRYWDDPKIGPIKPQFRVQQTDVETFYAWEKKQKEQDGRN